MVVTGNGRCDRLFKTNQYASALFTYCGHCVADALDAGYPSHATGPLVTVTAGQVPAMILPREWETLSNFASHPIGTGPYAVIRNSTNQLKIQAFDDFLVTGH